MLSNTQGDSDSLDQRSLLKEPEDEEGEDEETVTHQLFPTAVARKLYLSHFLSMWNSRVFEFGAVLYLGIVYPGTLLPMSVYSFARALSAIIFAPAVGRYIDTGDRLRVTRLSIITQRLAVALSCVTFYALATRAAAFTGNMLVMIAPLAFLACIEKLGSIMNLVSVEKDWVIVVAKQDETTLRLLNAQMRRIDLLCKLFGPLFISLVIGVSPTLAIVVNFGMNLISLPIEYFAILRAYHVLPELQVAKASSLHDSRAPVTSPESRGSSGSTWGRLGKLTTKSASDFQMYFRHGAFLPSISLALLYLTVLSFGGQMVTYLLDSGYTASAIGIARTVSVIFEVSATWLAPWWMGRVGPLRAGLWFSSWQALTLVAGTTVFWAVKESPILSASGLVVATMVSRVGLWGFDLCVQVLVQENVEAENRGAFSSVEAAVQNLFELLSYSSTIVFARPEQFKWPALISVVAVTCANVAYTIFVRVKRGHLLHTDKLSNLLRTENGKQRERDRVIERITSNTTA